MTRKRCLHLLPLFLLLSACGGAAAPAKEPAVTPSVTKPTSPQSTPTPIANKQALPFLASSTAPTETLAYDQARRRLAVALFNDETLMMSDAFSDSVASNVHLKAVNAYSTSTTTAGVSVEIGLAQEDLGAVFARVREALMGVQLTHLPATVADPIRGLRLAHMFQHFCERQKEILPESSCEGSDIKEARRELLHLSKQVKLLPPFADGIPSNGETFLRPLTLHVFDEENDEPLAGLPVLIRTSEGQDPVSLSSDKQGNVSYMLPDDLNVNNVIHVELDTKSLLGPLHEAWKKEVLDIKARPVGLARSAIVYDDQDPCSSTVTASVSAGLKKAVTEPVKLGVDANRKLIRASVQQLKTLAPALADEKKGLLDAILLVSGESEFASRMGTHRVWYEARGKITAISAWTGAILFEVETVVTESGVGEDRAERASQEALGKDLATKLLTALVN